MNNTLVTETDLKFLHQAIAVSRRSRENGNHPFGAILVSSDGKVLLEAENTVVTTRDATGHAETNLMRIASIAILERNSCHQHHVLELRTLRDVSGAMYWTGVLRLVYALSETKLYEITGANTDNPTMHLACREVLAKGQRSL